jgi:PAS domain S-box-containing protein
VCHPDDSELLAEALEPVLQGDADSFSCEFRFNTSSRAWKWVRARGTSLGGGDAGSLNISGTLVDIHDLRTAREQLASEHGLLRMIMDTSPVGIAVLSVGGGIPYISREAMKILGLSTAELQRTGITEFEHRLLTIEGNDISPSARPLRHALEHPELFSGGRFLFDAGEGRRQPVFINAVSMRDSDGSPTGVLVTVEDIADTVNAENEVRYREEQLRHARNLEAVGRLASGIAHDFNNLMAIIVGRAEVLSGSMKADPARVSKLNDIRDSALAAGKLAQQMLSFSRAQVGTMRSIDLNRAISDFRESIDRVAGKQVRCVFDFEQRLHQVITDPSHINQLLLTFVLNARDAMPKGGELRISTRNAIAAAIGVDKLRTHNCRDTGDFVVLTFSDTGQGMSDTVKARIFEPFFTTKEVGKGVGLGLSAAYGMVRTAGGFIEFDSELGRGSTFRIVLPAVKREPAEQRQKPLAASNSVGAKVLVVDPDPRVRDFVVSALKAAGYTVRSTTDRDGVQTVIGRESFTPAAVVLDLSVPGVSDLSLTAALQKFVPGIRILYTTSKGLDDGANLALQPVLAKPFGGAALVSELSRLLGQGKD